MFSKALSLLMKQYLRRDQDNTTQNVHNQLIETYQGQKPNFIKYGKRHMKDKNRTLNPAPRFFHLFDQIFPLNSAVLPLFSAILASFPHQGPLFLPIFPF